MNEFDSEQIKKTIMDYSASFNNEYKDASIILAAGHGKRIKSNTSKMLHKIWEVPTVNRVVNACMRGIPESNVIVVVGIKAEDVTKSVGKNSAVSFAFQEVQHGTGHAVQIALENVPDNFDGTVYVFPGDMGLLDDTTVKFFKDSFEKSNSDMMVLTGIYEGAIDENHYGRIIRVKEKDAKGIKSKYKGKVIEIMEYKDILKLDKKKPYLTKYKKKSFKYTRTELLENMEFNSGVYAFKSKPLFELIKKLQNNNAQGEIYITDLIALFNEHGYTVEAVSPTDQFVLMGFNNKSVLKEMDVIAKKLVYEKIKDIVLIDDPDDFFIAEDVVENLLQRDMKGEILDIEIGKGVHVGLGVSLSSKIKLLKNVKVDGKVSIGENVMVDANSQIVGSDEHPCVIESGVELKGMNFIVGSRIEKNSLIMHSILVNKKIDEGSEIKFVNPETKGKEFISNL